MTRKRGAQPGNANALKHGFYSSFFQDFEKKALDQLPVTSLQDEIEALRVYLQRFQAAERQEAPLDYETSRNALLTVCFAAHQIASMVRIQSHGGRYLLERSQILAWIDSLPSPSEDPDEDP